MEKLLESDPEAVKQQLAYLAGAEELIDRLHREAESQRQAIARAIHDDLGGLMVSAAMDLILVQKRSLELNLTNVGPLDRGTRSLQAAIDLGRRLVEHLRPSILDNFGLFAGLKWQLREASKGSSAQLTEVFPATEPVFLASTATAVFRVAEEAINLIFRRRGVLLVDMTLEVDDSSLVMQISGDGVPDLVDGIEVGLAGTLSSMQHRVRSLGGTVQLSQPDHRTRVLAVVPLPSEAAATLS